jgi:hypothetical protein
MSFDPVENIKILSVVTSCFEIREYNRGCIEVAANIREPGMPLEEMVDVVVGLAAQELTSDISASVLFVVSYPPLR